MLDPIDVKYFKLCVPIIGKETPLDIQGRCIVCGDSQKNKNKKRLHLYTKPSWDTASIKCFNCDYSASPQAFIKEFCPDLYNAYMSEKGYKTLNSLKEQEPVRVKIKRTLRTFKKPDVFIDLKKSKEALTYLKNRKINPIGRADVYYGVGFFNKVNLKDYIIIPLLDENNKWYGFYSRSTKQKTFFTYLPEENMGYKVWNFFNVDKTKTVYIFESIMDALSTNLKNSIAVLGADLNKERLDELSDPVFVFDNDKTGYKKAMKYLDMGYKVVDWGGKTEKDCNEMLKKESKNEISEYIKNNILQGKNSKIKFMLKGIK